MIQIYFDNVLVPGDDYLEIKNSYKMFDSQFYLGATPCNTFTIKVPNTYQIPTVVTIYMDNVLFATLNVDSYSVDDDNILNLSLVDNMVKFDKEYDASGIVPCTTLDILDDICDTFGVTLGTNSFTNDDVPVDFYDNTYTARDYISMIAEINGGYACIGADGYLYLRKFNNTPIQLSIDTCENFKIAEKRKVERVVFDNGLVKYESSNDDTLETLYLNNENVYINSQAIFTNIVNQILNFEFYNFSTGNCQVDYTATCGKLIKFVDSDNNEYVSISQYEHEYYGSWLGGYELNLDSVFQTETQIKGDSDKIKAIKVTQNRQQNVLDITVERVNSAEGDITDLQLTDTDIRTSVTNVQTQALNQINDLNTDLQQYKETVSSQITQTNNTVEIKFSNVKDLIDQATDTENEHYEELHEYIRFSGSKITLGKTDSPFSTELDNTKLSFMENGTEIAYISNNKMYITDAVVSHGIKIGKFAFIPRDNDSLSFRKVD